MYRKLADIIAQVDHYKALGQTEHYIAAEDALWDKVDAVESGGGYRLNGPTGCYFIATVNGMKFKWSFDFEAREANGKGYALFDRMAMREVALKLGTVARKKFAAFLQKEVLPAVEKRSTEFREAMNHQIDAEDCVRGIIAFAGHHQ